MKLAGFLRLKDSVRIKKYDSYCVIMDVLFGYQKNISPLMAFIMTLCDGTNTAEDIIYIVSKLFEKKERQIKEHILINLKELLPFIDVSDNEFKPYTRYKPEQFVFKPANHNSDSNKLLLPMKTPLVMTLALTNRCNFECIYCFKSSGKAFSDELTTKEWIEVVRQAEELQILRCNVTGGEPLLHPGFIEIIECLLDADIFPYISTNGSLITEKMSSRLSLLGIRLIQVSLDAPNADLHHKLSQTDNTFKKVIDGIRHLRKSNITVRIKSVITPLNYKEVGQLIDLCVSLGVSDITIDKFNPGFGGRGKNELIFTTEMVEEVKRCIADKSSEYKGDIAIFSGLQPLLWKNAHDITPCGGMLSAFAIQPNGDMVVCEQLDVEELKVGNIKELKITAMWGSDKALKILNPDPAKLKEPCKSCAYLPRCRTGCFSHTMLYEKNLFAPDPSCWKVHLEKNPLSPLDDANDNMPTDGKCC